ncbi:MAG TPA: cupredoxin family copper-binding protein [Steroidobacteraceae bacterium]
MAEFGRRPQAVLVTVLLAIMAAPSSAATVTIAIDGMRFVPAAASVKRGDTVVWVNRDLVPHTATAADAFDSHAIAPGKSWSYVARQAGRYDYVCVLHPMMKATLRVE